MTSPSLSTTCGTYLLNTLRDKALRVGLNPLSSPAGVQTYKTYAVNVLFRQLNLIYRTGKRAAPVRKWSPKRVLVQSELLLPSITLLLLQLLLLLSCFCWYLPTYYIGDKFFDDKFVDFFFCGAAYQRGPWHPQSWGFYITHNDGLQTVDYSGRAISSSQRPLPNTSHSRQTFMPPAGFEPTSSAGKQPQNYALDQQICRIQLQNSALLPCLWVENDQTISYNVSDVCMFCLHVKFQCFITHHQHNRQLQKMFVRPPGCYC